MEIKLRPTSYSESLVKHAIYELDVLDLEYINDSEHVSKNMQKEIAILFACKNSKILQHMAQKDAISFAEFMIEAGNSGAIPMENPDIIFENWITNVSYALENKFLESNDNSRYLTVTDAAYDWLSEYISSEYNQEF